MTTLLLLSTSHSANYMYLVLKNIASKQSIASWCVVSEQSFLFRVIWRECGQNHFEPGRNQGTWRCSRVEESTELYRMTMLNKFCLVYIITRFYGWKRTGSRINYCKQSRCTVDVNCNRRRVQCQNVPWQVSSGHRRLGFFLLKFF